MIISSSHFGAQTVTGTGTVGLGSHLSNNTEGLLKTDEPTLWSMSSPPITSPTALIHTGYLCAFSPRKARFCVFVEALPQVAEIQFAFTWGVERAGNLNFPRGNP